MSKTLSYMALTGGGMDLSWTICRGYMALGLLPPVHFCDLPRFAGYASDALEILDACRRSVKGRLQRCQRRLEDLQRLHEEIEGRKE